MQELSRGPIAWGNQERVISWILRSAVRGRKGIPGRGTSMGKCGGESSPERVRQDWSGVASVALFIVWPLSRLSVPCGEGLSWSMDS